jgi:hypothetical protein
MPDVPAAWAWQCFLAAVQVQSMARLFVARARGALENPWAVSLLDRGTGAVAAPRFSVGCAGLAASHIQAASTFAPFGTHRTGTPAALADPDQDAALARKKATARAPACGQFCTPGYCSTARRRSCASGAKADGPHEPACANHPSVTRTASTKRTERTKPNVTGRSNDGPRSPRAA